MDNKNNKIIHYIWYGGNPLSDLTKKCIQSWKKYLPDFEIIEWNEKNFDVNQCPFIKEAYEQKKWAFVADYTRFKVLEEYGGIYLDTDMEITRDIAEFLQKDLFMGVEDSKMINAAVVWAKEAHNPHIQNIVKIYEAKKHFNETGDLYDESVPRVLTKYFEQFGYDKELDEIQTFDDEKVYIYPMEYFYPLSYDYQNNKFTDNSAMVHHFDATWISPMEKFKTKMKRKNMVWVVYVIDFFINLKNKIKFFSNYRDLLTFFTMFLVMISSLLALKPITGNTVFNESFGVSVLQVLIVSLIWTFITANIRNIDLNFYLDKILGRKQADIDNGIIENKPLNLTQTLALEKRQGILFIIEYLITLVVSLFPTMQIAIIVPNNAILFVAASLINIYMIYIGINKKFRYRILELIPFGVILGILIASNFSIGLLVSLATFVFVLLNIIKNEPKKKRLYTFIASYSICAIIGVCIAVFAGNVLKSIAPSIDLTGKSVVENSFSYTVQENIVTEFNYMKNYFNSGIEMINNICVLKSGIFYFVIALIMPILLGLITKNKNYMFLSLIVVLNTVQLVATGINFGFLNVMLLGVLLLMTVQKGIVKIIER